MDSNTFSQAETSSLLKVFRVILKAPWSFATILPRYHEGIVRLAIKLLKIYYSVEFSATILTD